MHIMKGQGTMFDNTEWLAQVSEPIIDPEREIIDPHHHLWDQENLSYRLEALHSDTGAGHNITKTVFIECNSAYLKEGPEHLRPVGETQFVAQNATRSHALPNHATISAIVAHADLKHPELDDILDAHEEAADGLMRGIRDAGAWDPNPSALLIPPPAPKGLFTRDDFRAGVARLGERGLTYDSWHFHHQNLEFRDLAAAVPGTTMILDHFGTPLGVGEYAGKRDEIFAAWKDDIAAIAECPNVVAKLGGLAMPDNGFGWFGAERPPTSDELIESQARYYHHTIKCFGPDRCMFESNFPVDRLSLGYGVLWNAFKKMARQYTQQEQTALFSGTAKRVYRL
jgi:predicted TIM-barrel fold metal-dependent hydrolase